MKKTLQLIVLFATILNYSPELFAQCGTRYSEPVFTQIDSTLNVKYGENRRYDGALVELFADVYYPKGDTVTNRPMVIIAHGGSFVGGSRTLPDVVAISKDLARKGYVVASISYRLTTQPNLFAADSMIKAVMRAVQDGKGAVRFFKKSIADGNTYGIDSTKFFIGGSSAGAILAYQLVYMDKFSELPAHWQALADSVGGLEGTSGNPGHTTTVIGTFGYAGAVADTNWIEAGDVPFMGMHSVDDATVPYGRGYPLSIPALPVLYGTKTMDMRANNIGLDHKFYSYSGTSHPPYTSNDTTVFDSTLAYTSSFMYNVMCTATVGLKNIDAISNSVVVYPNPSVGVFNVSVANNEPVVLDVYNHIGQRVATVNIEMATATIDLSSNSKGIYLLHARSVATGKLLGIQKLVIQ